MKCSFVFKNFKIDEVVLSIIFQEKVNKAASEKAEDFRLTFSS